MGERERERENDNRKKLDQYICRQIVIKQGVEENDDEKIDQIIKLTSEEKVKIKRKFDDNWLRLENFLLKNTQKKEKQMITKGIRKKKIMRQYISQNLFLESTKMSLKKM